MGVGGGGAGVASCVGGVAGIDKSITRTAWSCAHDGEAMSGVFLTVCCWSGGRAGATKNADRRHFSENGGGNGRGGGGDGREGWGLGRGSRTRVVVREMSRVALVRARLGDVSARRKVAPGKLRDCEKEIRLPIGARAMLRVSPRGSETDEPGAALDGARLDVSFAAERSRATRVLDAERSAE